MPWIYGMGVGMAWMWIFPVLFLAGLAFFFAVFVRGVGPSFCGRSPENDGGPRPGVPEESPKEILDRRYAKGEITREQYLEMRKDLE